MPADWSLPVPGTGYLTTLSTLKDRDVDAGTMGYSGDPTNSPNGFMIYDRTGNKFQQIVGGSKTDLLLGIGGGGTGASSASSARTNLGLGSMATQAANAVAITGGSVTGLSALSVSNATAFFTAPNGDAIGIKLLGRSLDNASAISFSNNANSSDYAYIVGLSTPSLEIRINGTTRGTFTTTGLTVSPELNFSYGGLTSTTPNLWWRYTSGGTDEKLWDMNAQTGFFEFRALNDAYSNFNSVFRVYRTGYVVNTFEFFASAVKVTSAPLQLWDGSSASNLGLNFYDDTDTGIYRSFDGNEYGINFVVDAGVKLRLGNVGYATTHFMPYVDNSYTLGDGLNRWTVVYATTGTINTSDIRSKENIKKSDLGLEFIKKLNPVKFNWNSNTSKDKKTHYGLIAQELQSCVDEDFGAIDVSGNLLGLNYSELIAPIIKAIQELDEKIEWLKSLGVSK